MAARLIPAYQTFHTANGVSPLNGGKIHFYVSESVSTDKDTFSDDTLLTANTNPLVLDSAGRVQVDVWGDGEFKMVVADSSDTPIDTFDPITGSFAATRLDSIAELTALLKATLTDGDNFVLTGYLAQGDGGGGDFYWDASSTATEDGGFVFEADEGGTGRWKRIIDDIITIHMFGGFSGANITTPFLNALQFFRDRGTSIALTLPSLTVEQGGVLDFPFGNYILDFDTFEIDDIMNLTLRGEGAGVEQNFGLPITKLVFTGTSSGYGLRVVHNGARGFRAEGIAFEYADANFTGTLVELEEIASFTFDRCRFQHQIDGTRVYTAAILVDLIGGGKFGIFNQCSFDEADKGVIGTAFAGNDPGGVTFLNCVWNDLPTVQCDLRASGESFNFVFIGCSFDPINLKTGGNQITNGLMLSGSGWSVTGSAFAGSDLDAVATASFADLDGTGSFTSNFINTNEVGIINRGTVTIDKNRIQAREPLILEAGSQTTGSNVYTGINGAVDAISIAPNSGSVVVDIGPDVFNGSFTNSYNVVTDDASTNGIIKYSRGKDGSADGPILKSEHITLDVIDWEVFAKTTDYALLDTDTGSIFSNNGAAGSVTFDLPVAKAGLKYRIFKFTNQTIIIDAGPSGGSIFRSAATLSSTRTNSANELGALTTIIAVSSTLWLIVEEEGTWT